MCLCRPLRCLPAGCQHLAVAVLAPRHFAFNRSCLLRYPTSRFSLFFANLSSLLVIPSCQRWLR
jgi:hypothetical protein